MQQTRQLEQKEKELRSSNHDIGEAIKDAQEVLDSELQHVESAKRMHLEEQAKADKASAEFDDLSRRVADMKQDIISHQKLDEAARKDIGTRAMLLDEREAVLKRREQTVSHLEQQVQQSADLLNL